MTHPRRIPSQIIPASLKNGMLLDEADTERVAALLRHKAFGRYSKKEFDIPYGLIQDTTGLYVIYKKFMGKYQRESDISPEMVKNPDYSIYINSNNEYEIYQQHELGRGACGTIKLAQNIRTGEWAALKTQALQDKDRIAIRIGETEHENLVSLGKSMGQKMIRDSKNPRVKKMNFLIQYEHGADLFSLKEKRQCVNASQYRWPNLLWLDIVIAIFESIKEIHQAGILHRDIKLENFIFDLIDYKLAAVDFGLSWKAKQPDEKTTLAVNDNMTVGTPEYMAPEIKQGKNNYLYNEKTEVCALGILAQEILFNQLAEMNDQQIPAILSMKNLHNKTHFRDNKIIQTLVHDMQESLPEKRMSLDQALHQLHKFRDHYVDEHRDEPQKIDQARESAKLNDETRLLQAQLVQCALKKNSQERTVKNIAADGYFLNVQKSLHYYWKWAVNLCRRYANTHRDHQVQHSPPFFPQMGTSTKKIVQEFGSNLQRMSVDDDSEKSMAPIDAAKPAPTQALIHRAPSSLRLSRCRVHGGHG